MVKAEQPKFKWIVLTVYVFDKTNSMYYTALQVERMGTLL